MGHLLFAGGYFNFLIVAGLAVVAYAGIGYWTADPVRLFIRSPWSERQRELFRPPGYHMFLLGWLMTVSGTVVFTVHRLFILLAR